MKTILILLVCIMLFPAIATAGEIYGDIKEGNESVAPGVEVEIRSSRSNYSTETDRYGSYSIYVRETGKCTLTVRYRGSSPSVEIYSYKNPARYNLVLVRESNGRYSLWVE